MIDCWNPTKKEIIEWGNSNEIVPNQDWELALFSSGDYSNIYIICDFVSAENHPKKNFFLGVLYVLSGDTIKYEDKKDIELLSKLIKNIKSKYHSVDIQTWIERTEQLIQNPKLYSYEYWGIDSSYVYTWNQ